MLNIPHTLNSQWLWRLLTWTSVGLAALGTLLPLLPTTPFLLVAAWAAPKGSPRLNQWLWQHPHFGELLRAWHEHKAIPKQAKRITSLLLILSLLMLTLMGAAPQVLIALALLFSAVSAFVLFRPNA